MNYQTLIITITLVVLLITLLGTFYFACADNLRSQEIKLDQSFFKKVLKEYSGNSIFICTSSQRFRKAWECKEKREQIYKLARVFIEDNGKEVGIGYNNYALFESTSRQIRKEFLEWCISNSDYTP